MLTSETDPANGSFGTQVGVTLLPSICIGIPPNKALHIIDTPSELITRTYNEATKEVSPKRDQKPKVAAEAAMTL